MESVPAGDLDAFYLKDWPEEHRQSAVVRLGRSVLYVIYNGPGDLREHTDYLAALLS
jgi:hypothetical protein